MGLWEEVWLPAEGFTSDTGRSVILGELKKGEVSKYLHAAVSQDGSHSTSNV